MIVYGATVSVQQITLAFQVENHDKHDPEAQGVRKRYRTYPHMTSSWANLPTSRRGTVVSLCRTMVLARCQT